MTHLGLSFGRLLLLCPPLPRCPPSAGRVRSSLLWPVRARRWSLMSVGPRPPPWLRCRRSCLTTSKNAFSTLTQFLAEASTKSQPRSFARACPSCVDTSRSVTRSHLLPTSITGAWPNMGVVALIGEPGYVGEPAMAVSFTLWIWLWKRCMRANEDRDEML